MFVPERGFMQGSKQHCRDMPLIIKNKRIASREAEVVSESVERCLCEAAHIPKNLPAAVEIDDDTAAGSSQRKVSTTRIADVLRPEIRRLTAQPDNSVERIRKYIPAELLVAWAMIKVQLLVSIRALVLHFNTVCTPTRHDALATHCQGGSVCDLHASLSWNTYIYQT